MTTARNQVKTASSLILAIILFSLTLTYATAEDNYQNDTNPLPTIFEATLSEGIYKTNIIINPTVAGVYSSESNYKIDLAINPNPIGGMFTEGVYKLDLIPYKSFPDFLHDITLSYIGTTKTIVGQGYKTRIAVTITNREFSYEKLYVDFYADSTAIGSRTSAVTDKGQAPIEFVWVTIGVPYGYYTIKAYAIPVPGEVFTGDNTLTNGVVMVTIPGDVNGDRIVTISDAGCVSDHWTSPPGLYPYDPNIDINDDGVISIGDAGKVSDHWGQYW